MGTLGGILRATSGAPQINVTSAVKNPALQGNIDSAINQYGSIAGAQDSALGSYINKYMSGEGAAAQRTGQEIGAMSQFYNGDMAGQLAQLRTQRRAALMDAANVASQQAMKTLKGARLSGDGGTGSYAARMAEGALIPIRTQAALADSDQARSDLGYVTGNQLALAGQRNNLASQQAAYGLVPQQVRMQMLQGRLGYLGGLTNLDQANKFYGLRQTPNKWADIADSVDQGILNAAAIYSSMGGGMGGGGGGMSEGGYVDGPGSETSDSIPTRLSDGEYVVPAEAVRMPGVLPMLERIRKLALHMRVAEGRPISHGRGYDAGGLAASAQQLGNNVTRDLAIQWMPATMVGADTMAGPMPSVSAFGRRNQSQLQPWEMPQPRNEYFTPSNYQDITPKWQDYANYFSKLYNDPSSPKYIAPGTYE